tara:strand:- start:492 stop:872 length:381 start_codon:yes stop_codon:yes gene_type:complete
MNYKLIILSIIIVLVLDYIYLSTIKNLFLQMILKIQKKPLSVNIFYAILSYLLIIFALNYFILNNKNLSLKEKYLNAFILGFVIYGVYEATNASLFSDWSTKVIIIDSLWGGILFLLTTYFIELIK